MYDEKLFFMDYVFVRYDVLDMNPVATGIDPGVRTANIFALNMDKEWLMVSSSYYHVKQEYIFPH